MAERGEDPPAHDAGPRGPTRPLVADVGFEERVDAVQVDGAQDRGRRRPSGGRRDGPGVVERRLALAGTAHGGVDVDVVGRVLEHALDRPAALVGSEERGIAVRAEQRRAVVRRQQRRPLEADEVGHHPRHQHGDRGRDSTPAPAIRWRIDDAASPCRPRHASRSPSRRASGRTGPTHCAPASPAHTARRGRPSIACRGGRRRARGGR